MGKYLLRRILQMIPVVLGTTLLVYALVFALPGDPVKAMFGDKPVNEAVAAQIRAEYNLDKPFIVQYLLFLKNALTLDFGKTFSGQLVIDVIGRAFPVTIKLALMAFVFEAVFGVIFGVISGLKKGKWCDTVILIFSLLLISVPTFVTGFLRPSVRLRPARLRRILPCGLRHPHLAERRRVRHTAGGAARNADRRNRRLLRRMGRRRAEPTDRYLPRAADSAWRHRGAPDVQNEQLHLEDHSGDDAVRLDLRGTNRARCCDGSQEP